MEIDFKELQFLDIEGKEISVPDIHKIIANLIYLNSTKIDLLDIALKIFHNGKVDLTDEQINDIKNIVRNPNNNILAFAKKSILDYLNKIKE